MVDYPFDAWTEAHLVRWLNNNFPSHQIDQVRQHIEKAIENKPDILGYASWRRMANCGAQLSGYGEYYYGSLRQGIDT